VTITTSAARDAITVLTRFQHHRMPVAFSPMAGLAGFDANKLRRFLRDPAPCRELHHRRMSNKNSEPGADDLQSSTYQLAKHRPRLRGSVPDWSTPGMLARSPSQLGGYDQS